MYKIVVRVLPTLHRYQQNEKRSSVFIGSKLGVFKPSSSKADEAKEWKEPLDSITQAKLTYIKAEMDLIFHQKNYAISLHSINNTHLEHLLTLSTNQRLKYYDYLNRIKPYDDVVLPSKLSNASLESLRIFQTGHSVAHIAAKSLNEDDSFHGNWNIENAKDGLNQFMRFHNIQTCYEYQEIGPEHAKSHYAEMEFFVKQLNRTITARETSSTKKSSSNLCALSLVRQLYHNHLLYSYSNSRTITHREPYPVAISPELVRRLEDFLQKNNIVPVLLNGVNLNRKKKISLLLPSEDTKTDPIDTKVSSTISWSPPDSNWNVWTACSIERAVDLDELSGTFRRNYYKKLQNNQNLKEILDFRSKLPAFDLRNEIIRLIKDNSVIIIHGATGCGKTTQIPQYILEDYINSGRGAYCNIVVTQPRRMSAISMAQRIADERDETTGESVGYSVRFDSVLPRPFGSIMFCTLGMLLRKLESGLRGISHVIVDEIHERSVNSDFLLVVLREMIQTYPDLRVILMSATIDTTQFSNYFGNCPVIGIEGRTHPVQQYFLEDCIELTQFKPWNQSRTQKCAVQPNDNDKSLNDCIKGNYSEHTHSVMAQLSESEINFQLIETLLLHIEKQNVPGAVLIFLPGWASIFGLMKWLQNNPEFSDGNYVILPCHSQLPQKQQLKVFARVSHGVRKIILSTNICETSITIDDVVYVIDTCKSKTKHFTSNTNMTNYGTEWAGRANLKQRMGRAGRVRPGVCFTLCSRARFESLEENVLPEVQRIPLHELALKIKLLHLGDIQTFLSKVIEPPPRKAVIESEMLLRDLKCLDAQDNLTPLGRILARLPVEPRLGKMMILGNVLGLGDIMTSISAYASTASEIFTLNLEQGGLTDNQKAFGGCRHSDHIVTVNALENWRKACFKDEDEEIMFCEQEGLELTKMRVMYNTKRQLVDLMKQMDFPEESMTVTQVDTNYTNPNLDIATALLCMGLYPNVCYHKGKGRVLSTPSGYAIIHKTSVNYSKWSIKFPYPFFVFGEKFHTEAVSCKQITMVSPLHLLIFGSRKVDTIGGEYVRLDNWLNYQMNPYHASLCTALRPAIENLISFSSASPGKVLNLDPAMEDLVAIVKDLCVMDAFVLEGECSNSLKFNHSELS